MSPEELRGLAERFVEAVQRRGGPQLGFDLASIRLVEDLLERERATAASQERRALLNLAGAYLGECLIRGYGGTWKESDRGWGWGVVFDGTSFWSFPFAKVQKQLENGRATPSRRFSK